MISADRPATPLIVGNWKMNGDMALLEALATALGPGPFRSRIGVCPPATLVREAFRTLNGLGVMVGAQDCHPAEKGAHTGDLSATMLVEAGARLVLIGHSERRHGHGESSRTAGAKAMAAVRAGLWPIVCVGDTLEQRASGAAIEAVRLQLRALLETDLRGYAISIAYEPVWAIGSGEVASHDDITRMHAEIRLTLDGTALAGGAILYGGSVTGENAADLLDLSEVDGLLIGGASLRPDEFAKIANL